MRTALVNGRVITPQGVRSDCAVLLNDSRIEALVARDDAQLREVRVEDLGDPHLVGNQVRLLELTGARLLGVYLVMTR